MVKWEEALHRRSWRGDLLALAGIILLGIAIYGHTLNVPWYLDDIGSIVENRSVHQLQAALGDLFASRGLANLTFALNYRVGGTSVAGYHLVNIAIHLITSCLVFFILKRVFPTRLLFALGGALIFVAHPLQTQAVTYIVQRSTSLAALFFFLSLYLYIRAREAPEGAPTRHWLLYAAALFYGALAVLTKQNTAVLPVALILFDRYFLSRDRLREWHRLLLYVAPFCLAPAWVGAQSLLMPMFSEGGIGNIGGVPDLVHLQNLTPVNYLVTQFSVIWLYLRLLFIPYGQVLDYDYPIVEAIWAWKNWIGFLGIAALFAAAAFLRRRDPIVSAGILWFFLGLAVESTIIPLDPVFEHRLYIPMFGFALVVMGGFARLPRRGAMVGIILLTATLSVLTWQRNSLWNEPVAFYEDNLRRAPRSERVHLDLANAYMKQGQLDKAQVLYERALEINPGYVLVHINLSRVYATQRDYQKAVDILLEGLRRNPMHFQLYNNLAVLYNFLGQYREAAAYLQKGVALEPDNATVHFNLAVAYEQLGQLDEAIARYRRAVVLAPAEPIYHFTLGVALHTKGDPRGALQALLIAHRLNPGHTGTLYNAALVYLELGDVQSARNFSARLQRLDPGMGRKLERRIDYVKASGR
jgi:protein O-mannosyl-transferase